VFECRNVKGLRILVSLEGWHVRKKFWFENVNGRDCFKDTVVHRKMIKTLLLWVMNCTERTEDCSDASFCVHSNEILCLKEDRYFTNRNSQSHYLRAVCDVQTL